MPTVDEWLENSRMADGVRMTDERLDEVFELVSPANHGQPGWKYPIDCDVPRDKATSNEIDRAVIWFAGGCPDIFIPDDPTAPYHVSGAGYYAWVGA